MASLKGFVVAFAGVHTANPAFADKKIAEVKDLIKVCGGSHATKIDDSVTHLVATPAQFAKAGAKITDSTHYPGIKVVDFEWLNKSLASKTQVDEDGYLLDPAHDDSLDDSDALAAPPRVNRKRQRADDDEGDGNEPVKLKKSKVMKRDGQIAQSGSLRIPVDEHLPTKDKYRVYIDEDGMIFDATLNQTNTSNNNNKFYRIQVLVDHQYYFTWTRWGRVGNVGQSKMLGDGTMQHALKTFYAKFKEKNGGNWEDRHTIISSNNKYTFIELEYEDSSNEDDHDLPGAGKRRASRESLGSTQSAEIESKLPGPVQRLMQLIFNQQYFTDTLATLDYDTQKMPLGKLSKRTLLKGYETLKELAALVQNPNTSPMGEFATATEHLSNTYWSLIPHVFGMNRAPIIHNMNIIKKEIDLLETLTDMQLANDIIKTAKGNKDDIDQANLLDRQYQGLKMREMAPLDLKSSEAVEIAKYLRISAGSTHHMQYKVQDIFRIERIGENDRFAQSEHSKIKNSDRRLLWHGILSQGLRIAPVESPISGYMFGKGVYLADMSTKSANYCAALTSGNIGLLLLCEAELGKPPLKLSCADYEAGERAKAAGHLSTWGVGMTTPVAWKDAGCISANLRGVMMPDCKQPPGPSNEQSVSLLYNEYIVYNVAQIRLRYLLRVEMK